MIIAFFIEVILTVIDLIFSSQVEDLVDSNKTVKSELAYMDLDFA